MLDFLLSSSLSCSQADAIMLRIETDNNLKKRDKIELVKTIKDSTPECRYHWDAND